MRTGVGPVTGARALYLTLLELGVTEIFGMDCPEPLYRELEPGRLRPFTVRDERSGAIMADGLAKCSFRPGVCAAMQGIGALNMVPGLAESKYSSTPVVAIVQEVEGAHRQRHPPQDVDHATVYGPVVKEVFRVEAALRIPAIVRQAFRTATSGRPGPVVILCPKDRLEEMVDPGVGPAANAVGGPSGVVLSPAAYPWGRTAGDPGAVDQAADLLLSSTHPVLLAGGGAVISGAWREIRDLAEFLHVPVATTLLGRGAIAEDSALALGALGSFTGGSGGRGRIANRLAENADVLLVVGSKLDQVSTDGWRIPSQQTKVIQVDVDPAEVGRNCTVSVALIGDAQTVLRQLVAACRLRWSHRDELANARQEHARAAARLVGAWREAAAEIGQSDARPIRPERVMRELSSILRQQDVVVADASYSSAWVANYLDAPQGRRALSPRGLAGLGWALPAAIGAARASPGARVVAVTGDGALGYVVQELETAARYGFPVTTVVLNNAMLGYQKHYEEMRYGRSFQCDLLDTDFARVAKGFACASERVSDPARLHEALRTALLVEGPSLVDVVVDPGARPPLTCFDLQLPEMGAPA